jgi:signal recognition particle GTPase
MMWACDPPEEEGEDWENCADPEDESLTGNSDHAQGLSAISRLAIELEKSAGKPILEKISIALSVSPPEGVAPWKYPYGGLMALGHATEGLQKIVKADMQQVVSSVIGFMTNPSARVRYAAVSCLALMVIEYEDNCIQEKFAHHIFPAISTLLLDPTVRVRAQTAVSCCNLLHKLDLKVFEGYLDTLVKTLYQCLQESLTTNRHPVYQQQLLSALSSLACQSRERFVEYYPQLVETLSTIIGAAPKSLEEKQTQAKAIEALGLMTWAVGKEAFLPVSTKVMGSMQHAMGSCQTATDDPRLQEVLISFSRIAEVVEQDFAPYLDTVLPPVIRELEKEVQYKTIQEEQEDSDEDEDSDVDEVYIANEQHPEKHVRVQLKTSDVQEKILALKLLRTYLRTQGPGACNYLAQVWEALKKTMVFMFDPDVRTRAAALIPTILEASKKSGMDQAGLNHMIETQLVPQLLTCITAENELEVISKQVLCLNQLMEQGGANCLSPQTLERMHNIIKQVTEESVKRRADQMKAMQDLDPEEEDDEDDLEELEMELMIETDVLDSIIDLITALLKGHTQQFLPTFTSYYIPQLCSELIKDTYSPLEHKMVLCVMGDFTKIVFASAPDLVAQYVPVCAEAAVKWIQDKDPNADLCQSAAWYLGTVAETCPATMAPFLAPVLAAFGTLVQNPVYKAEDEWWACLCNAVSSLLKITAAFGTQDASCAPEKILPVVLGMLPCQGDEIEAKIVHRKIVQLIHENNPALLGPNNCNIHVIGKFLQAMVDDTDYEMVEEEIRVEAQKLLGQVYQMVPGAASPVA